MLSSSKMVVLLERHKESGLSVKSFCSNEGIAPSTFFYWQKKLRKEDTGGRFIPLLVRAPGSAACPTSGQRSAPGTDRVGRMDWNALTKDVEKDIELAKNMQRYQLDISFDNMNEGAEYQQGTDFKLNVSVKSTFDIAVVTVKVNGEDLSNDSTPPYRWDAKSTPLFKKYCCRNL